MLFAESFEIGSNTAVVLIGAFALIKILGLRYIAHLTNRQTETIAHDVAERLKETAAVVAENLIWTAADVAARTAADVAANLVKANGH